MDFTEVIDNSRKFAGKRQLGDNYDDRIIDRFHNRYTVALLICSFIAISTYDYLGKIRKIKKLFNKKIMTMSDHR